jgi:hypothetical protein
MTHNSPIRFKLGTIVLWNLLTKRKVVDATDPTLNLIKQAAPKQFEDLINAPLPATREGK